jgi:predicted methyltransferase
MRHLTILAAALALSGTAPLVAAPQPPTMAAAVAATDRTADNVKLDAGRKPAQLLQFLGLKRGMHVLDLFGANAYWAEIEAPVVGPKGHVTVWQPTQFYRDKTKQSFGEFAAKHTNVSIVTSPFEAPALPKNYADFVILNDNYHDTYWQNEKYGIPKMDPNAFLKAIYAAMKPGAVIGVIDHVALPNDDVRATVEKFHRIDPEVVKADFKRAGFVLAGSSDMLRNPADPHSTDPFDESIKGKTDRFVFKFRKPR